MSNSYVLKKLTIVVYPMRNQYWGRIAADETGRYGDEVRVCAFPLTFHDFPSL